VRNTHAAKLLSQAIAKEVEPPPRSVADLYRRSTPYTFAMRGLGDATMYVLWRLFQSEGLDPDQWATAGDTEAALVSFRALKERDRRAEAATKRGAARRHTGNTAPAGRQSASL
jgi:hypothetical protein